MSEYDKAIAILHMCLFIWHSMSFSFSLGSPFSYMCKKKLVSQQKHDAIALQNLLDKLSFSRECLQFLFQRRFTCIISLYWETKISIVQPSVNGLVSNFSRGVPADPEKILALFIHLVCLWPPQAKTCISVLGNVGCKRAAFQWTTFTVCQISFCWLEPGCLVDQLITIIQCMLTLSRKHSTRKFYRRELIVLWPQQSSNAQTFVAFHEEKITLMESWFLHQEYD